MGALKYIAAGTIGLASMLNSGRCYADEPKENPAPVQSSEESALIQAIEGYRPILEEKKDLKTSDENITIAWLTYNGNARGQTTVEAMLAYKDGNNKRVVLKDAQYHRSRYSFFELHQEREKSIEYIFIPGDVPEKDVELVRRGGVGVGNISLVLLGSEIPSESSLERVVQDDKAVPRENTGEYQNALKKRDEFVRLIDFASYIKRTVPRNVEPFITALPKKLDIANYDIYTEWARIPSHLDSSNMPLPTQIIPGFELTEPGLSQPKQPISVPVIIESFTANTSKVIPGYSVVKTVFSTLVRDSSIDTVITYENKLSTDLKPTTFDIELFDKNGNGTVDRVTFGRDRELDFILEADGNVTVDGPSRDMYSTSSAKNVFNQGKALFESLTTVFRTQYRTLQMSNAILQMLPEKKTEEKPNK